MAGFSYIRKMIFGSGLSWDERYFFGSRHKPYAGTLATIQRNIVHMKIKKNTQVKLKTFLGKYNSPNDVDKFDDFWKLIGQKGIVIEDKLVDKERVLVLFDKNLDDFQLANHNPIKNSLMIKKSDLELDL